MESEKNHLVFASRTLATFQKSAISETYGEGASDNRKFRVKSNPLIVYTEPLVKRSLQMLRRFAFTDPSLHKRCRCRQTNEKHYSLCKTGIVKRVYKIRDRLPSLWLNIDRLSDHQAGWMNSRLLEVILVVFVHTVVFIAATMAFNRRALVDYIRRVWAQCNVA